MRLNVSFSRSVVQAISDDQPPPVVPRKHSGAEMTAGKALPNTYVKMDATKKGEALFADCINRFQPYWKIALIIPIVLMLFCISTIVDKFHEKSKTSNTFQPPLPVTQYETHLFQLN